MVAYVAGGVLLAVGSHIGEQLVALGGAFLAAGLLARAGRRIGLPTIPLFIIAGILFGPTHQAWSSSMTPTPVRRVR